MLYTVEQITKMSGGRLLKAQASHMINKVVLDSRKITQPDNALFIAIVGEHYDAHRFLNDVYAAGVRCFMIEKNIDIDAFPDASIIQVNNSLQALQALACSHRKLFDIPVIGVTGSNGKTIVKEWLNTLLADDYIIARSPRSYNSQVGVALSVLSLEDYHTLAIFEAGISQPNEMNRLEQMIRPTLGIFTNVHSAHRESFDSSMHLSEQKAQLFARASRVICCADYPEILEAISRLHSEQPHVVAWSKYRDDVKYKVRLNKTTGRVTELDIMSQDLSCVFGLHFVDDASIENAIHCIVALLELGYHPSIIEERLNRLTPLTMRMEQLQGVLRSTLINDVYSSDLDSLQIALDFMRINHRHNRKVVILSDMLQTGLEPMVLYKRVNELLLANEVDYFVGIGSAIHQCQIAFTLNAVFYTSVDDFMQHASVDIVRDSMVLIKGARNFHFERLTEYLQERTHDTVLEVNMNALAHNLHYFRNKIKPSTRLMVMVKASGYGSGSYEIASLLEFNKVDYLTVAYTDEGVALRKAGVSIPIMVMNPERSSLYTLIQHHLEPEIYSFRTLQNFLDALGDSQIGYPIHLKIDTGMHRLGFVESQINELIEKLNGLTSVKIASVFTHLAGADEKLHDAFTHQQLNLFTSLCDRLQEGISGNFLRHALNTAGIQRFPESQMDMVRLGIGLYGVSPHVEEQQDLMPVSSLFTVISQIKLIPKGDSIGYGRKFFATENMRIATIPLGYADGLRRSLSNGVGCVWIGGKRARVVGNVCMDMIMVDVTNIPCVEGDRVEVFGHHLPLTELAALSGTIPYEILTSISQRVKRIYTQE